jgi:hypothetical protein
MWSIVLIEQYIQVAKFHSMAIANLKNAWWVSLVFDIDIAIVLLKAIQVPRLDMPRLQSCS